MRNGVMVHELLSAQRRSSPLPLCDLVGVSALPARATSISLSPSAPEGSELPILVFLQTFLFRFCQDTLIVLSG